MTAQRMSRWILAEVIAFAGIALSVPHARAQMGISYSFELPSVSKAIADSDVALVAHCVSVTPRHSASDPGYAESDLDRRLQERRHMLRIGNVVNEDVGFVIASDDAFDEAEVTEEGDLDVDVEKVPVAKYGVTRLEVRWITKGPASIQIKQEITLSDRRLLQPGKSYLLLGDRALHGYTWLIDREVGPELLDYMQGMPALGAYSLVRGKYYFNYLESPHRDIALDAQLELIDLGIETEDKKELALALPVEEIRQRLRSLAVTDHNYPFYLELIQIAGDDSDAKFAVDFLWLERYLNEPIDYANALVRDIRLRKAEGLAELDGHLKDHQTVTDAQKRVCFSALKLLGDSPPSGVSRDRIVQSTLLLMQDRRYFIKGVDVLSDWHEWSVLPQLAAHFNETGWRSDRIRRVIVNYLVQCALDWKCVIADRPSFPLHSLQAIEQLHSLQQRDAKTRKVIWNSVFGET